MIIRRLAKAIQEQNWFTVTLEVLIVVIGIFLGLQVNDWNQDRKDRTEEVLYIERLIEDMEASITETNRHNSFQTRSAKRGAIILSALKACEIKPEYEDDVASGFYHLGKVLPVDLARTTIDELRASAKFRIIQNSELRQALSHLVLKYENHRSFINDVTGRLAPAINYVDSQIAIIVKGPIGGIAELELDNIEMNFEALCKDRRFYNSIATATNYTWDVIAAGMVEVERIKIVKSLLLEEQMRLQ